MNLQLATYTVASHKTPCCGRTELPGQDQEYFLNESRPRHNPNRRRRGEEFAFLSTLAYTGCCFSRAVAGAPEDSHSCIYVK